MILLVGLWLTLGCVSALAASVPGATPVKRSPIGMAPDSTHYVDGTRVYPDTALYQGMQIKLDIGSTLIALATGKGAVQTYELGMNWRLKQRFYPVFEAGYAQAQTGAEGGLHKGAGGFMRIGMDLAPLKKHPERFDALLVGVRLAGDVQGYSLSGVDVHDPYGVMKPVNFSRRARFDAWAEVVAGTQVQIYAGLNMGWALRIKILMTQKDKNNGPLPYYIPGFGFRDNVNWGLSYYIGYRF